MLVLVTLCCVFVVSFGAGDDRFETTKAITSVPYGTGQIAVWQDEEIHGRFYMAPLSLLLPESTKVVSNIFTGNVMLQLSLLLWSLETREIVRNHLENKLNLTIPEDEIQMIPIKKLRFSWNDRVQPALSHYRLINHWTPYTNQQSTINFHVTCQDAPKCNTLETAVKTDPGMFYALELQYLTNPVLSRQITVTGAHLASSNLYSDLSRMPLQSDVRYVTSDVTDALAAQTVAVALSASFPDSVSAGDEVALTNALSGALKTQETSSRTLLPTEWQSVYWSPSFSRPDKIATYLNYVLKKEPNDTTYFSLSEKRVSDSEEQSACAVDLGLTSSNVNLTHRNSSVYKIPRQKVLSAVRGKYVEWDGEKFRPSPVTVFRLNLSVLNSSRGLVSGKVRVREYAAVRRAKVLVTGNDTHAKQLKLSPELVQSRLNRQINSLELKMDTKMNQTRLDISAEMDLKISQISASVQKLNETTINLDGKLDRATAGLKRALNRTTSELKGDFNRTTRELQAAMVTDAVMNTALNSTLRRIGSVYNDWPEYCRLSNYHCGVNYYSSPSAPRTASACMRVCDADARCHGFDFRTDTTYRCNLLDFVCSVALTISKSASDNYVKLAHVPMVTAEMWRTIFTNMSLVNIPTDPCRLVGEVRTYTRV